MKLTHHAADRADERVSWPKGVTEKMAEKAFNVGIRRADVSGSLNRYLFYLEKNGQIADTARIYGEHVYLFRGSVLVTIFPLQSKYKKLARQAMGQIKTYYADQ